MPGTYFSLLERRFKLISLFITLLVGTIGFIVVAGWATEFIKLDLWDNPWSAVKLNTGICFLASALSIFILNYSILTPVRNFRHWSSDVLSLSVFIIGLLTLIEYFFNVDLGIDELLVPDIYALPGTIHPGRMALLTAFNFTLVGGSIFLLNRGKKAIIISQAFTITYGIVGLVNFSGYIFHVEKFYTYNNYTPMAFYTAIGFMLLMLAVFFSTPRLGIMQFITDKSQGGRFFRIIFPVTLIMVMTAATISNTTNSVAGKKGEFMDSLIYPVIFTFFAFVLWITAFLLYKYEKKLRTSEASYSTIVDNSIDAIFIMKDRQYSYVNPAFTRLSGYTLDEVTSSSFNYLSLHPVEQHALVEEYMEEAIKGKLTGRNFLASIVVKTGAVIRAEINCTIQRDESGGIQIFGIVHDVTGKWQAERKQKRLLRINQFINGINEAIIRLEDEDVLYRQVCDITVNIGKFKMVWVGNLNLNDNHITTIAQSGATEEYFSRIYEITHGKPMIPISSVIRDKKYFYSNNIAHDPLMGQMAPVMTAYGFNSVVYLPLFKGEAVAAVLSIYSGEQDFFDAEELQLLENVAANISFALNTFHIRNEKKEAEQKLEKSERLFRMMAENASDLIYRYDLVPFPHFSYVSPSATDITGYSPEEHYANPFLGYQLVHPDDIPVLEKLSNGSIIGGNTVVLRWIKKNGEVIWTEQKYTNIHDTSGKVIAIEGIARDITDAKLSEQQLEESEKKYRELLTDLSVGVIQQTPSTQVITYNKAALELLGLTEEQLLGRTSFDTAWNVIHEDGSDFPGKDHPVSIAIATLKPCKNIIMGVYRPSTQDRVWLSVNAVPEMDANDQLKSVIVTFVDITEQRTAEQQLKEALRMEERFREALNMVPTYVYMKDTQSRYTYANDMTLQLFGCKAEALIGSTDDAFFPPETVKELQRIDQEVLAGNNTSKEITVTNEKGERRVYLEIKSPVYADPEKKIIEGLVGISADITERKQSELLIKESLDRLNKIAGNVPGMIYQFRLSPDGTMCFPYTSDHIQAIFGLTAEEVKYDASEPLARCIHPDDYATVMDSIRESATQLTPWNTVFRVITTDGIVKHLHGSSVPATEPDGSITWYGYLYDATKRLQTEALLREYYERLNKIASQVPGFIFQYKLYPDGSSCFPYASAGIREIYGVEPEEVLEDASKVFTVMHPADKEQKISSLMDSASKLIPWQLEYRVIDKSGKIKYVAGNAVPQKQADGSVLWHGYVHDITERRQTEQSLQEYYDRLNKIASQVPGVIYQYKLNPDGSSCFPYASQGIKEIYGVTPEEVQQDASAVFEILHPDDYDKIVASIQESAQTLTPWRLEYRVILKNGKEQYLYGNAMPQRQEDGCILWHGYIYNITERKKTEALLQESYDRLQKIASQIPGIIFQFKLQPDGKASYPYVSPAVTRILGLEPDKLREDASYFQSLLHPDDVEIVRNKLAASAQALQPVSNQHRVVLKDGTVKWLQANLIPQKEADGSVLWYGYTADVTEQKQAEEKLLQLSMAVEQSPASIVITDTKGTIKYVNSKFTQITGYTLEEALGENPRILKSDKTSRKEYENLWKSILAGKEWRGEFENIKKNGEKYWELASISPITNSKGEIINFLAVKEDITQRKWIEKELQESEEKYRTIFSISPFPMWMIREGDYHYLDANEAAVKQYGYTRDEFLHMTAFDIRPASEHKAFKKVAGNMSSGYQGVWLHQKKNGEIISVEINVQRMVHKGIPCFVSIAVDITEKQKAEKQLKEAYEEVRQLASHLQDVREEERYTISREIHDELGQQLTALKMGISFTKDKISKEDKAVQDDMEDLKAMIVTTINSVRKISNHLRPRVLDDLGLVDALQWQCEEFEKRTGCPIRFTCHQKTIFLSAEKRLALFRIFQESLTNIMRYANATEVEVDLIVTGERLRLTVNDNGKGFDTTLLKNKQTLGILGMKERALMLEGKIKIESKPGKGTTVLLSIPYK